MEITPPVKPEQKKTILLIEDDDEVSAILLQVLRRETPHHVYRVSTSKYAFHLASIIKCDLLILRDRLPGMTGMNVYNRIAKMKGQEGVHALLLGADLPWQKIGNHIISSLEKPVDLARLLDTIQSLFS